MSDYDGQLRLDPARLWAGGAATAVVAALAAVVGIMIARGLAGVAILAPKGSGLWGNANTATYAVVSALVALAATALLHLLSVATPKPTTFFGWIMVLVTLIGVVVPLGLHVALETKIATALLNLLIGLVITLLLISTAGSALRRTGARTRPPQQWDQQPPRNGDQTRPYGSQYYDR